jgi:hypothetical protein
MKGSSKAILLHNEVAAMTHDSMLTENLPELYDFSCNSDSSRDLNWRIGQELLDVVDRFAGTEDARPVCAQDGRRQVTRYLEEVTSISKDGDMVVSNLVKEMTAMGL